MRKCPVENCLLCFVILSFCCCTFPPTLIRAYSTQHSYLLIVCRRRYEIQRPTTTTARERERAPKSTSKMVASAIFITDLTGKPLISRNYRGDIPLTSAIEKFASYLLEVEDDTKKPVFHVDSSGDFLLTEDVGCTGVGGETFVYVQVSYLSCVAGVGGGGGL